MTEERGYVTVSLMKGVADAMDEFMKELGYWPSRGAFVREAVLEKIKNERELLQEPGSRASRSSALNRSAPGGETGKLEEK